MKIEPDDFAKQVNHLAALGRLVVPRAFRFAESKILFVGYGPFVSDDLGDLLPDEAEWYRTDNAPHDYAPDTIILGREFPKGLIKGTLKNLGVNPKILPQEGFLDELLFGHDWWNDSVQSFQEIAKNHRGLHAASSAGASLPAGVGKSHSAQKTSDTRQSNSPKTTEANSGSGKQIQDAVFNWPSTEAAETNGANEDEYELRAQSRLNELGYNTNKSPSKRWQILTNRAVPELGLYKVANMIAWYCRSRKQQGGGRQKYHRAIAEWEHDLNRLKRELYPKYKADFHWPDSEP